jgi:trigger factor
VSPEELTRALYAEASRYPGREKEVVEYFKRTPQALAALRAPLFEDKVVDFILERAKIEERKVTPEELIKEPESPTSSPAEPKAKGKKKAAKKD